MKDKLKKAADWLNDNSTFVLAGCTGVVAWIALSALHDVRDGEIVGVRTGHWDNGDEVVGVQTRGNGVKTYTRRK